MCTTLFEATTSTEVLIKRIFGHEVHSRYISTYHIYVMSSCVENLFSLRITDFSAAEVDEFRGLFMEHSTEDGLPGSFKNRPSESRQKRKDMKDIVIHG